MKRREFLRGLLALPVVGVGAVVLGVASKRPMAAMRGGRVGASELQAYLPSAEVLEQMWAVQMKREPQWRYSRCK